MLKKFRIISRNGSQYKLQVKYFYLPFWLDLGEVRDPRNSVLKKTFEAGFDKKVIVEWKEAHA